MLQTGTWRGSQSTQALGHQASPLLHQLCIQGILIDSQLLSPQWLLSAVLCYPQASLVSSGLIFVFFRKPYPALLLTFIVHTACCTTLGGVVHVGGWGCSAGWPWHPRRSSQMPWHPRRSSQGVWSLHLEGTKYSSFTVPCSLLAP